MSKQTCSTSFSRLSRSSMEENLWMKRCSQRLTTTLNTSGPTTRISPFKDKLNNNSWDRCPYSSSKVCCRATCMRNSCLSLHTLLTCQFLTQLTNTPATPGKMNSSEVSCLTCLCSLNPDLSLKARQSCARMKKWLSCFICPKAKRREQIKNIKSLAKSELVSSLTGQRTSWLKWTNLAVLVIMVALSTKGQDISTKPSNLAKVTLLERKTGSTFSKAMNSLQKNLTKRFWKRTRNSTSKLCWHAENEKKSTGRGQTSTL